MNQQPFKVWSVRQSTNLWNQAVPDEGAPAELGLFLVFGACFGMLRQTDPQEELIRTRFGSVQDDVERSCRAFHRDGALGRFKRFAVMKTKRPGSFVADGGGCSALHPGQEEHAAAKSFQLERLTAEFPDLLSLQEGGEGRAPFRFNRQS